MQNLELFFKTLSRDSFVFTLKTLIKDKVKQLFNFDIPRGKFEVLIPKDYSFGDYASNIGFKLAPILKRNPYDISKSLVNELEDEKILKIQAIGGYLNFFLKEKFLVEQVKFLAFSDILFKKKDKILLLEFGQPNTHKDPHIGHFFSYVLGESLARIFQEIGLKVKRANYQGDIGLHVAKCLFGVIQKKEEFYSLEKETSTDFEALKKKATFLQNCYVLGSQAYEKDIKAKNSIIKINKAIYEQSDQEIIKLWEITRIWSLDFYRKFEKILGVFYHRYYFESEVWKQGKRIIEENLGKVFEKSQNAIVFKGEKFGLHTRVFITSEGNPTYEGKEIGLISFKLQEFSPDFLIVTTAKEQEEYFKVVVEAADKIFPSFKSKFKHVPFGMVNLKDGKMSSRTGNIVSAVALYERVKEEINRAYDVNERIASIVALAAIKYSFLNLEIEKDMVFDIEESIAKEGNSGPYLLYTFVRIKSLLEKVNRGFENVEILKFWKSLEQEEKDLLRHIFHFDEIIIKSAQDFSPHHLTNFLYETAQLYNKIYQNYPILKAEQGLKQARLLLSKVYGRILKKGLYLLGIDTVERL